MTITNYYEGEMVYYFLLTVSKDNLKLDFLLNPKLYPQNVKNRNTPNS